YSQRTRGVGLTRERDGVAEGGVHLPGRYGAESDLIRTRGEPATEDGWQKRAPLGVDADQIDVLVPYAGARGRHEGGSDDSGLVLQRDRWERLLLSGVDEVVVVCPEASRVLDEAAQTGREHDGSEDGRRGEEEGA